MADTTTATLRKTINTTLRSHLMSYLPASSTSDPSHLNKDLNPTALRHISPSSFLLALGAPSDLTITPIDYIAQFGKELTASKVKSVDYIPDVVIDTEGRFTAARSGYTNKFTDNGEEVQLEFAWFFEFTEDGRKITKVREFVDADVAGRYQRRVAEILKGLGKE